MKMRMISSVIKQALFLTITSCILTGCQKESGTPSNTTFRSEGTSDDQAYQRAKDEALAGAQKEYEQRELDTNRPPSVWHFPNATTGPGLPLPSYRNFYTMKDRFPSYLLCEYPVREEPYDPSKELGWLREALEQIRRSGPTRFPSIKWVAVAIRNVAEHKDASTFEQSFKVGAVFKADEVFDASHELAQLITNAQLDRHPFKYDLQQPTPGEQQRWLTVEQHAATSSPTTGAK
jgi:hypothetical protein